MSSLTLIPDNITTQDDYRLFTAGFGSDEEIEGDNEIGRDIPAPTALSDNNTTPTPLKAKLARDPYLLRQGNPESAVFTVSEERQIRQHSYSISIKGALNSPQSPAHGVYEFTRQDYFPRRIQEDTQRGPAKDGNEKLTLPHGEDHPRWGIRETKGEDCCRR